jgi:hypothetical protein
MISSRVQMPVGGRAASAMVTGAGYAVNGSHFSDNMLEWVGICWIPSGPGCDEGSHDQDRCRGLSGCILRLVDEGVVAFRVLEAGARKAVFRVWVGKSMGRDVIRRAFLETWKWVNRVSYEGLERGKSSSRLLVVMAGRTRRLSQGAPGVLVERGAFSHEDPSGCEGVHRASLHP